jgi:glutamyl-tRNA reductase
MTAVAYENELESPRSSLETDLDAVLCVGISHRTAPLALRERLALTPTTIAAILSRFGCGQGERPTGVSELVILSTCNRLELYAAAGDGGAQSLFDIVAETTGVDAAELGAAVYTLTGADAVRHLCRTAAGLDSMILGEPQILGQIGQAYSTALSQRAAGHMLSTLFRGAMRAGRRARVETAINRNPATVSSVAVKLVSETVPDLRTARVLVVGAGEVAELTLAALHHRGARDVCVVSRTREHAERLSARFATRSVAFDLLHIALASADVVITSTSAPHHVITRRMLADAMSARAHRPMILVDIAVPRDVDPTVADLPGVRCVDLDDLQRHVSDNLLERELEVPRAESILEEEAAECIRALQQLGVQPLIADLRAHTESVRRDALARASRHFAHLSDADRAKVDAFSESLINRLLHEPMVRLRAEARKGQAAGYALAVRELFGLGR